MSASQLKRPMNRTTTERVRRQFSEPDRAVPAMDQTDWEIVAIEANLGGVSPDAARAAIEQADELFNNPTVTVTDILPAAHAILALLRRHVPPTHTG